MIDPRILLKLRHKLNEELIMLRYHLSTQNFNFITNLKPIKDANIIGEEKLTIEKSYSKSKKHLKGRRNKFSLE